VKIEIHYSNEELIEGKVSGKILGGNANETKILKETMKERYYSEAHYSSNVMMVPFAFAFVLIFEVFVLNKSFPINSAFFNKWIDDSISLNISIDYFIVPFIVFPLLILPYYLAKRMASLVKPYWMHMNAIKGWVKK